MHVHLTDNAPLIALHNKTVITLVIAADLTLIETVIDV